MRVILAGDAAGTLPLDAVGLGTAALLRGLAVGPTAIGTSPLEGDECGDSLLLLVPLGVVGDS